MLRILPAAFLLSMLALASAHAVVVTWSGLGSNNNWTTAGNWQGNAAPLNNGTADISFGPARNTSLTVDSSQNVNTLNFSGSFPFYSLQGGTATTLTIQTGLFYSPSNFTFAQFASNLSVALPNMQTWSIFNGALDVYGNISGAGGLAKLGGGELALYGSNSFAGGVMLTEGGLIIGSDSALGAGTLTVGPAPSDMSLTPYLGVANGPHTINNSVILNGLLRVRADEELTLGGAVTLAASTTIVTDFSLLSISGNVGESGGARQLAVNGIGALILEGAANTYTGGTYVQQGALIFGQASSIPASGALKTDANGYIGLGTPPATPSDLQGKFLDKFEKPSGTQPGAQGTIGFDTDPHLTTPNTFTGNIYLTGFNSNARLGSATTTAGGTKPGAILSGTITPQGPSYRFGGGGGTLEVSSALVDQSVQSGPPDFETVSVSCTVVVVSPNLAPLTLRLTGANTYTGGTSATHSAVIFSPSSALPAAGGFTLGDGGYIGLQLTIDLPGADSSLTGFLNRFPTGLDRGFIGFDSADRNTPRTITGLDLTRFTTFGLATTTNINVTGTLALLPGVSNYRFAGYKGGILNISSTLADGSGPRSVVIGDPNVPATIGDIHNDLFSAVSLSGANTYTGGTTLYAGLLGLGHNNALGAGALTVAGSNPEIFPNGEGPIPVLTAANSGLTIGNNIILNTDLDIEGGNAFTLSGNISGLGELTHAGSFNLTLSGNNTFTGGLYIENNGIVTLTTNTAAGAGELEFGLLGGQAVFTSSAPKIYGLFSDNPGSQVNLATGSTLTIDQAGDTIFHGAINGSGASLVKQGSGRLRLKDGSSYSGGTTITGGALIAGNNISFGSGAVTLNGGKVVAQPGVVLGNTLNLLSGKLGGFGTFNPSATPAIGSGLSLAPGGDAVNPVGVLGFGASGLTFASAGAYHWQIQSANLGPGIGFDSLNINGLLNITASSSNKFSLLLFSLGPDGQAGMVGDFNPGVPYSWTIATASGGIAVNGSPGFDPAAFAINSSNFLNAPGGLFSLGVVGNNLQLNFSPIPEPSTYALMGVGLGFVLLTFRRRKA